MYLGRSLLGGGRVGGMRKTGNVAVPHEQYSAARASKISLTVRILCIHVSTLL